jgi:cytochrome c556
MSPSGRFLERRVLAAFCLIATFALLPVGGPSQAHEGATGAVKERQQGMIALKEAMKAWKTALESPDGPKPDAIDAIAVRLSENAGARLLSLFPENGPTRHTDAVPEIWTDWKTFSRLANDLEERALSLQKAKADKVVLRSEFQTVGMICKACHERFRKP